MFWPDPTHQPTHPSTHPPNYTPTHGWGSLHRFQIFKQNWNISISSSAIEFWLILGSPQGVEGWVDGSGGVVRGCPLHMCTCMHTHTHTCMHAHACTYDIIGNSQDSPNGGCHLQLKLSCLMCICACVCMHACMCVHVHVYGGHPSTTPHPHTPTPPHPHSRREPKTPKFNKSWTNWDNLILFEDSLPLNIPELI